MISSWLFPPNPLDEWWSGLSWRTQMEIGCVVGVITTACVAIYYEFMEFREMHKK